MCERNFLKRKSVRPITTTEELESCHPYANAVVMQPSHQARKWKKAQVEDQVDVRSYAVRTEDGRVFRRNQRHLKKYDPPPAIHTPEVEVGPSKITTTSTPPAEGAVKESEEPPIEPPKLVSADLSTPPSSPTVPAPAPVNVLLLNNLCKQQNY